MKVNTPEAKIWICLNQFNHIFQFPDMDSKLGILNTCRNELMCIGINIGINP